MVEIGRDVVWKEGAERCFQPQVTYEEGTFRLLPGMTTKASCSCEDITATFDCGVALGVQRRDRGENPSATAPRDTAKSRR